MKTLKNILPCVGKTDNKEQTPLQEKFFLIFFGNIIFVAATNLLTPLFALFVAQISPLDSASTAGLLWGAFIPATVTFLSVFSYIEWFNKLHDADLLVAGMLLKMAGWGMYVAMPGIGTMFCAQLFLGAGEAAGMANLPRGGWERFLRAGGGLGLRHLGASVAAVADPGPSRAVCQNRETQLLAAAKNDAETA